MLKIETKLSQQVKKNLLEEIKNASPQAFFIGSSEKDFNIDTLIGENPNYEAIKNNVIFTQDIRSAYYDVSGNLCFEILLNYEDSYDALIYALAIGDKEKQSLYAIALTPKIQKVEGVGGTFIFKTNIEGESASMVFKNDTYISEAELSNFKDFLNYVQTDLKNEIELTLKPIKEFNLKLKAIQKQIVIEALENYINEEFQRLLEKQKIREEIGRKDYFYRNSLPPTHIPLGQVLKASDYPLLWFYTIGITGNDGRLTFRLPTSDFYSKGTSNPNEVGEKKLSGLPNITGAFWGDSQGGDNGAFWIENGGCDGYRYGGGGKITHFDASRSSPIYGRSDGVEVNRILYLEGIYASTPLSQEQKLSIKNQVLAMRKEIRAELAQEWYENYVKEEEEKMKKEHPEWFEEEEIPYEPARGERLPVKKGLPSKPLEAYYVIPEIGGVPAKRIKVSPEEALEGIGANPYRD
ncbi:hypothetical protein BKH41_02975 [Helicobacter sp. 12S02232-10]|uniref:tail fiber protein n=1 Tax=Helicobacter sp. 12S02232-10 TaxID=1476197 RepID=UPI000BA7D95D|nr:tail fiber protein [Helicobacter sp. 12S02232-10]PAF49069.1 hypothetical protein BKH41_02975 [Helicobacter sp. 12S02232-10]